MGRIIPYIVDNKKYLKPPTRILYTVQGQGSPQLSSPSLFFHVHLPVRREAAWSWSNQSFWRTTDAFQQFLGHTNWIQSDSIRLRFWNILELLKKTPPIAKMFGLFWIGITGCPRSKINPKRGDLPGHLLLKPALTSKMSKKSKNWHALKKAD